MTKYTISRTSIFKSFLSIFLCSPLIMQAQLPEWRGVNQAWTQGGSHNSIREMTTDYEGGIIVTGRYNGDLYFKDGDAGFGNAKDGFLAKVNADGTFAWGRGQGKRANDTQCFSVDTDGNGNVYVAGDWEFTAYIGEDLVTATGNTFDGFIASYDKNGGKRWKQTYRSSNYASVNLIRSNKDDLVVLMGYFDSQISIGQNQSITSTGPSRFLVAIDTNKTIQWSRDLGREEYAQDMRVHSDGSVYYTFFPNQQRDTVTIDGITAFPQNNNNCVIVKLDNTGTAEWVKQLGTNANMTIRKIRLDDNGNLYIAGEVPDTVTYGGVNIRASFGSKGMVYKFNSDGDFVDDIYADESVNSLAIYEDKVYLSTYLDGTINIGGESKSSVNGVNFFIAEMDTDLNVNWIHNGGEGGGVNFTRISASENYVGAVGYFSGTTQIGDSTIETVGLNNFHTSNLLVKDWTGVAELGNSRKVSLFPNPSDDIINLQGLNEADLIRVFNMSGTEMYQRRIVGNTAIQSVDVSDLSAGLYLVQITNDLGESVTMKFLKN